MTCPECDGAGSSLEGTILGVNKHREYVLKSGLLKSRGYDPDTVWSHKRCKKCFGTGKFRETSDRM